MLFLSPSLTPLSGKRRTQLKEVEGIRLTYVVGSISANGGVVIPLDGKYKKWKPFDVVYVFNNSGSDITVYINQDSDKRYPVASNTERKIDKIYAHNLKITEDDGSAISSGEVVLMLERKGIDADELAKRQIKLRWL